MASWFADLFTDERVKTLSDQVSTLRDKVWDLEGKSTQLLREKSKLEKQFEETKKAAQVFAGEKKEVERSLKGENDKLRLEVLAAEGKYSQSQAEVMKLKMELDALAEEKEAATKAFDAKKAEMMQELEDLKRRTEEIQANKDLVDIENDKLRSEVLTIEQKHRLSEAEVERLKVELGTLVEAKEEAAKAFEAEKLKIMKELEDLKWKVEEIQTSKDLVIGENDKLRLEVVTREQKLSLSEEEVERLKMELDALAAVKEAATLEFDAKKTEIMKEMEDLNEKVEEIKASKDLVMGENDKLRGENDKLRSDVLTVELKCRLFEEEIERLKMELGAQLESKEATTKAFNAEKAEIMKELEDLKREVEEIQAHKDLVIGENDKLRLEVLTMEQKHSLYEVEAKKLKMELDALAEAKEEAAKAFDVEKAEITEELVDLRRKMEEIQASKELVMVENDKLRSDVLTIEQKHSLFETEIEKLKMEMVALTEAKEAAAMVFDAEKTKIMKESEDLKREAEQSQANKELAEEAVRNKDALANNLRAELEEIHVTMSQLEASYNKLDAKHARLTDKKNSIQKALDTKKTEVALMKSKIEALENYNAEKDGEIGKLNAALEEEKKRGIQAIFSSGMRCLTSCISKRSGC